MNKKEPISYTAKEKSIKKRMEKEQKTILEEIQGTVNEIITQVKKLIREGSARRIIIQNKNGKTLFQSQLTIGVAGTAFITAIAPVLSAITMFVLFVNDAKVLVEKDINEDENEDEYEVEAEVIEIEDEDEEEEKKKKKKSSSSAKSDKTVGKKTENGK